MYATLDEIKASAQDIDEIITASNGQITAWANEATAIINNFCNMDFSYEVDTQKSFRVVEGIIYFDKPLARLVSVSEGDDVVDPMFYSIDPDGLQMEYLTGWSHSDFNWFRNHVITVEGDWGDPMVPDPIKVVFLRLVKRLAVRSSSEDYVNINGGYTSESVGDAYLWNIGNGTVRNIFRPEDFVLLWPYINHGTVIE